MLFTGPFDFAQGRLCNDRWGHEPRWVHGFRLVNSLDGVGFFVKLFVNGICYLGVSVWFLRRSSGNIWENVGI